MVGGGGENWTENFKNIVLRFILQNIFFFKNIFTTGPPAIRFRILIFLYISPIKYDNLEVHFYEIFFVLVFRTYQTHLGQIIRLLNFFNFVLEFADLFNFLKHSLVTQLTQSLIPRQLSQRRERPHIN